MKGLIALPPSRGSATFDEFGQKKYIYMCFLGCVARFVWGGGGGFFFFFFKRRADKREGYVFCLSVCESVCCAVILGEGKGGGFKRKGYFFFFF